MKNLLLLLILAMPSNLFAESIPYDQIKDLEKMSFALTGKPLKQELLLKYVTGELSRDDVFNALSTGDSFVDHFAKFWTGKIGVQSIQNIADTMNVGSQTTLTRMLYYTAATNMYKDEDDETKLPRHDAARKYDNMRRAITNLENRNSSTLNREGSFRLFSKKCGSETWIFTQYLNGGAYNDAVSVVAKNKYTNGVPVSLPKMAEFPTTLTTPQLAAARLKRAVDAHKEALSVHSKLTLRDCSSDRQHTVAVTPHWDPDGTETYRAAKFLVDNKRCGPTLDKCFSDQGNYPYRQLLGKATTLEPGRIIAKTVAEDLDFKTILTTPRTVIDGAMSSFLREKVTDAFWDNNFPGGKYNDKSARYLNSNSHDQDIFWVNRNKEHAGVLTTFAFQIITNGRRAKANRAFEVFTCSQFVVPDGAVPDPNDANPDLRQRKYCAYCHRPLEPMAAFFNRWPETGRVNYEYDSSDDVEDNGLYRGDAAVGVAGFGELLANSASFDSCSIKRTFEFLHGRDISESEAEVLIPKYLEVYKNSDNNIRQVMSEMLKAREFNASQSEGGQL